jgi:hypothetical protein
MYLTCVKDYMGISETVKMNVKICFVPNKCDMHNYMWAVNCCSVFIYV